MRGSIFEEICLIVQGKLSFSAGGAELLGTCREVEQRCDVPAEPLGRAGHDPGAQRSHACRAAGRPREDTGTGEWQRRVPWSWAGGRSWIPD